MSRSIWISIAFALALASVAGAQIHASGDQRQTELDALSKTRDYTKTFQLGRQILIAEPENFYVLTKVVEAGFNNYQAGNSSLTTETISFARRALKLIESGKVKDPSPLADIANAREFHRIALGALLIDHTPEEAANLFFQVLQVEEYKREPSIYYYFGRAIMKGDYQRLVAEFKQKYEGKPETPDAKALLERINQLVGRIVDAYARAVALSIKPEQQASRDEILRTLTPIYKALHNNSDAGLNDLIANVLSKPMPQE
jgi:hypothetical protein